MESIKGRKRREVLREFRIQVKRIDHSETENAATE